jgi:hypothetical protein
VRQLGDSRLFEKAAQRQVGFERGAHARDHLRCQ